MKSVGVRQAARLTDGIAAVDGDAWKTGLTARFVDSKAFVEYDLGAPTAITAIWLHGDNNDQYHVWVSSDGEHFDRAWRAAEVAEPGLRPRVGSGLAVSARYLRLSASGGDHALAASELQVFSNAPAVFPPDVPRKTGVSMERHFRDRTVLFGFFLVLGLFVARAGARRWLLVSIVLLLAGAGFFWTATLRDAWPALGMEISLLRGIIASVALVAVLRECFSPPRHPAHRGITLGVLGLCAVGSFGAFYNLGHPQFYDEGRETWTFGHFLDLRQYYATAKYFDEVGYRGIYEADVLAYAEDKATDLHRLRTLPMRDLESFRDTRVESQRARIEARRTHFSDERWQAYIADTRYFRGAMGDRGYLDTLLDFGGNATPVWMGIAHLLFEHVPPSNTAFTLTGLIDPILLIVMFLVIGRTFGVRTALVSAVLFGANDFIMYGTNWGGATLRHDWLAYLGFGLAAIKAKRLALGGAFFGAAIMIRAFPLLALFGVSFAIFWSVYDHRRQKGNFPSVRTLLADNRDAVRVLLGAAAAMAVLFVFSISVLPISAWADWYSKVSQLESMPHPATAGLRTWLGGPDLDQADVLKARLPIYIALLIGYVCLAAVAARGRRLEQAAVLGLMLLPIIFSPAIYYLHVLMLFPLVAAERPLAADRPGRLRVPEALVWLVLLGLCVAQYPTVRIADFPLHFYLANNLLLAALGIILLILVYERAQAWLWADTLPSQSSPKTDASRASVGPAETEAAATTRDEMSADAETTSSSGGSAKAESAIISEDSRETDAMATATDARPTE